MVQRKVANKIGIKPHLHKLDTQLVNLKPSSSPSSYSPSSSSSSQTHEKLKKIMKKSRSIKRLDESRSAPPFRNKKTPPSTPATPQKQSPNYMKSTSSFEARKEQYSPSPKTPTPKGSKTNESASGIKGSRPTSLKMVRTLTKTPSFKPVRPLKKMILCEDVDSQRATCSSTLKDSKFPDYLQLNHGGTELDGTSAMKVCPYSYCSLNGHHHAPVPPLKCFLSARRRALKTQKGFKLGCLSPHQIKHTVKKSAVKEPVILAQEEVDMENEDFFIDIYHNDRSVAEIQDKDAYINLKPAVKESTIKEDAILVPEEVEMEDKDFFNDIYGDGKEQLLPEMHGKDAIRPKLVRSDACESFVHQVYMDDKENKGGQDLECSEIDWEEGYYFDSDLLEKTSVERLYSMHQELYDEESVSSGAWSDEDGDSASDGLCEHMKINQDNMNHDPIEVSSTVSEQDTINNMDDVRDLYHPIEDQNMNNLQEPKTFPDFAAKPNNETDNNHTKIIYNIIQFNISVFINGEKTVNIQVPATSVAADNMDTEEAKEEQSKNNEDSKASEVNQIVADEELPNNVQDIASTDQLSETEKQVSIEQECNEYEECNHSNSIEAVTDVNKEPAIISDADQTHTANEIISETDMNLRDLTGRKKPEQETKDEEEKFNPRGPNFLPETADPDAETVDLRHQTIDERKNAEEWMVDFALQRAVTTLAPARKKKVALLVEAFEKVMPDPVPVRGPVLIPMCETHNRHASKAFTNSRPMQACS